MSETRFKETTLVGLKRRLADRDYQLEPILEELSRLGPQYAMLLARQDFIPPNQLVWWVDGIEAPVPLASLDQNEQERVKARLASLIQGINARADVLSRETSPDARAMAHILRNIVIVPDDSAIWSLHGQPVLIEWGYELERKADGTPIVSRTTAASPAKRSDAGGPTAIPTASMLAVDRATPLGLTLLSWLPFVVIVGAIYWMLLAACSIAGLSLIGMCPATSALAVGPGYDLELAELVRAAERELERKRQACATPPTQPSTEPESRPQQSEIDERVRQEGGRTGSLQITLVWNTKDDLDLHVRCPGGIINFGNMEACGGKLDIDRNANSERAIDSPVENAVWATSPPSGEYQIVVKHYRAHRNVVRPVRFTVRLRIDGRPDQHFEGVVSQVGQAVTVHRFRI